MFKDRQKIFFEFTHMKWLSGMRPYYIQEMDFLPVKGDEVILFDDGQIASKAIQLGIQLHTKKFMVTNIIRSYVDQQEIISVRIDTSYQKASALSQ